MSVQTRRIYDRPWTNDGIRVLVDRLWPRGMTKARAAVDEWCTEVAPSTELRKWYHHDPARFDEFARRYRDELKQPCRAAALVHLSHLAKTHTVTLLTATKDIDSSEAAVLAALIERRRNLR
jgi:uncharacterized protein YeaO (DUF488 family)